MEEIMQNIYGIGPSHAKELCEYFNKENIYSENEKVIRHHLKDKKIFYTLPIITKTDLLFNPIKQIPRNIIHLIDGELKKYLTGTKFEIAGSYRRNKMISRDVDIVMLRKKKTDIVNEMIQKINTHSKVLYIYKPYARGDEKASIIFEIYVPFDLRNNLIMTTTKKVRIKVDIFLCNPEEFMFTLLFATGSGDFNVRMRAIAKNQGYLLNQRGLFDKKSGEKIHIKNEKHLFSVLNIEYKNPEDRI